MLTMEQLVSLRNTKARQHTRSLAYYDATITPRYMSEAMHRFFWKNPHYTQNWTSLVVDSVRNKLVVDALIVPGDDARTETLETLWDHQQLASEADLIHEMCHATGEAFIVAGVDEDGPHAYAHDPRAMAVYYGGRNPREMSQAAQFWLDGERHMATVWTVDESGRVWQETLEGSRRASVTETAATEGRHAYKEIDGPQPTKYNTIPVWHFRRSRRNTLPEFHQVTSVQDSINKTFTALGYAIENAANKVRWAITLSNLEGMKNAEPGAVIAIPPAPAGSQPVSVGEFSPENFGEFQRTMDRWIDSIASITATPRHYFGGGAGANLSGEALQAMEAPLVAKVRRYQRAHASEWEGVGAFLLTQSGKPTDASEVTCAYADPRSVLTVSQAQARLSNKEAGMPLITQLRDEGWREPEIELLLNDKLREEGADLDERQLEQVYDKLAERSQRAIEPMLEQALQFVADAALAKLAAPETLERLGRVMGQGEQG